MMANKWNTVIYTGATSELEGRVWQHKNKTDSTSFTSRYNCNKLVRYAETNDVHAALEKEKIIKDNFRQRPKRDCLQDLQNCQTRICRSNRTTPPL